MFPKMLRGPSVIIIKSIYSGRSEFFTFKMVAAYMAVKVFKSVGPACITVLSGQVQGITIKIYLDKMKVKSL